AELDQRDGEQRRGAPTVGVDRAETLRGRDGVGEEAVADSRFDRACEAVRIAPVLLERSRQHLRPPLLAWDVNLSARSVVDADHRRRIVRLRGRGRRLLPEPIQESHRAIIACQRGFSVGAGAPLPSAAMAGIFKAYDVRGVVPDELNEDLAERIGRATALHLKAKRLVVGRDMRASGVGLSKALIRGITSTGADVVDVGVVSTPMQYFACGHIGGDGGVQVTASHNPAQYNGFKISGRGVVPVGSDSGLAEIEAMAR